MLPAWGLSDDARGEKNGGTGVGRARLLFRRSCRPDADESSHSQVIQR